MLKTYRHHWCAPAVAAGDVARARNAAELPGTITAQIYGACGDMGIAAIGGHTRRVRAAMLKFGRRSSDGAMYHSSIDTGPGGHVATRVQTLQGAMLRMSRPQVCLRPKLRRAA